MSEQALDPKQQNRDRILSLFFQHESLSKPQLAEITGLSMPTINGHMKYLETKGLIGKGELLSSSGGRPASSYTLINNSRLAIGVEVRKKVINICLVDLSGKFSRIQNVPVEYVDEPQYTYTLEKVIEDFIAQCGEPKSKIMGIGITLQAAVNKEGNKIIYSGIISTRYFHPTEYLSERLGIPVKLCHDVKADAMAELWGNREITNGIYIALSEHLGGALIKNHRIEHGRFGYAGSLEHLTLGNKGRLCYCGRKDCLETYCSLEALLEGESMPDFFRRLREEKSPEHRKRWVSFMKILSKGLYQTWLLLERRIILGGEAAIMLTYDDVLFIEKEIQKQCTFNYDDSGFVCKATVLQYAAPTGCALPFLAAVIPPQVRPIEAWDLKSQKLSDE